MTLSEGPKFLFLLKMTPTGFNVSPKYDARHAMVVCARTTKQAREYASNAALDEKPIMWLNAKLSSCSRLGLARESVKLGVVITEGING